MEIVNGKGNFIDGCFINAEENVVVSKNSAQNFNPVFRTHTLISHVDEAVRCAKQSLNKWAALSIEERIAALIRLKDIFQKYEHKMATAISLEMGKIFSESLLESKNLSARIELMVKHGLKRIATEHPEGILGETRYHAQGVLAVLGPYNFPAHLVNAHVIPALMTGNTVVVKFSEICPWVGEIYAECIQEAGLPHGVFNMVQGNASIGHALVKHPLVRGILFTGSYATGRKLTELTLDEPHKILALEMGGKNIAVVLKDANLYQALSEIIQGAFLTTGQRCTATSRIFVEKTIANQFIDSLIRVTKSLRPGDPFVSSSIFGPLANNFALERYLSLLQNASKAGCETLVESKQLEGGAYVTPCLHLLKKSSAPGYTDTELFGPDICIETINDIDEAIAKTNESPYGLSNALFSASKTLFEKFYLETNSGVLNFNRSTNGAYGNQPFGGIGKSGNQRAAGIDAVRYTTYPVAVNHLPYGETESLPALSALLEKEKATLDIPLEILIVRHEIESLLERFNIPFDDANGRFIWLPLSFFSNANLESIKSYTYIDKNNLVIQIPQIENLSHFKNTITQFFENYFNENFTFLANQFAKNIHIPKTANLPRSEAMLRRFYQNNFLPKEKKTPVINLNKSKGPYLCSIDEEPLVLFDAASQIASLGLGFGADPFAKALIEGELTSSILTNLETSFEALQKIDEYTKLLLSKAWPQIKHVSFVSSGAEANEKAFDLCRMNGLGGRRIIAFEGSFHGRTLISTQATYNPQKRTQFELKGFEATFIPFPKWTNPKNEPVFDSDWILSWSQKKAPLTNTNDYLLNAEINSLTKLKTEIEKGDICVVIVEPMQCEGGDNYATARFFNGLRALTRAFGVPLIFDEVQTGFQLLGPFYAHTGFNLKNAEGETDGPDCITLAKKAQVGVCLSVWLDTRPSASHILQIMRGLLQAKTLLAHHNHAAWIEEKTYSHLNHLKEYFPDLVLNPRNKGYALAFDLPSNHLAMQLINQRFYRGFMVYIAGEKTVRFRFNLSIGQKELHDFFGHLKDALVYLNEHIHGDNDKVPEWVTPKTKKEISKASLDINLFHIEVLTKDNWSKYETEINRLEKLTYEENRQDSMEFLKSFIEQEDGLGLILLKNTGSHFSPIGYTIGGPLEHSHVDGPKQDIMRGQNNTFYSANVVLEKSYRGQGLGFKLKKAQIEHVRNIKNKNGSYRYEFMTGRNKVGSTTEIGHINQAFGALVVEIYEHQYGDLDAKALYYRISLRKPNISIKTLDRPNKKLNWSSSIQAPVGSHSEEIINDLAKGVFNYAIGTKLTLSNWITPDVVRYAELLKYLAPKACQHVYFTSGRDEVVDKGLKALKLKRPNAHVVIGFQNQYVGYTTAAARSLSERFDLKEPFSWFNWPNVSHPCQTNSNQSLAEIKNQINHFAPDKILGIVIELIGEKSGFTVTDDFLKGLDDIRCETSIPIVFVETVSALGRNGHALFKSDVTVIKPNMIWWYTGAQLGHVFADDAHYVATPLALISTWDGDEISIRRTYRHLLIAQNNLSLKTPTLFEVKFSKIKLPVTCHGEGLWHVLHLDKPSQCQQIITYAKENGLILNQIEHQRIAVCPPINVTQEEINRGFEILNEALSKTFPY